MRKKSQTKGVVFKADGFDTEPDLSDGEEHELKKKKVFRGNAVVELLHCIGKTVICFLARKDLTYIIEIYLSLEDHLVMIMVKIPKIGSLYVTGVVTKTYPSSTILCLLVS
jgi:hypothetical protein